MTNERAIQSTCQPHLHLMLETGFGQELSRQQREPPRRSSQTSPPLLGVTHPFLTNGQLVQTSPAPASKLRTTNISFPATSIASSIPSQLLSGAGKLEDCESKSAYHNSTLLHRYTTTKRTYLHHVKPTSSPDCPRYNFLSLPSID